MQNNPLLCLHPSSWHSQTEESPTQLLQGENQLWSSAFIHFPPSTVNTSLKPEHHFAVVVTICTCSYNRAVKQSHLRCSLVFISSYEVRGISHHLPDVSGCLHVKWKPPCLFLLFMHFALVVFHCIMEGTSFLVIEMILSK